MASLMMHTCLMVAVGSSLCGAAPGSLVVLVRSPVSVHRGHTTTLPCWLNPPQNAEGLEVHWYRGDHFDSPIVFYKAKKFEQEASYMGRVSFGSKGGASGGLTTGDVSLQLVNATLEDAGDYTCYVSSDQGYDRASVSLIVTETGTPLLLSAVWQEDNMVNVSCESRGWYPEPSLRWSDQKQVLTPNSLKFSEDSSGLLSVRSWLLVFGSSEVSCSVGLSGEEAKEARLHLVHPLQPDEPKSRSLMAGWVAFAVLLIATLAILGVLYFKKRGKKAKSGGDHSEENQKLLSKEKTTEVIQPTRLSIASKCYENVTIDKMANKYLSVKDRMLRDACFHLPDGQNVTCLTAIKGTSGFSSGQHYWEVSMGNTKTGIKQSWWVGVTSATAIPQELEFSPTASNGFWFLSSSPDRADSFQLSTEPKVLLPVRIRPTTVGVYLNCDSGELSFYDVEHENENLIGSLTVMFTGEVFPFFNPGKGDKAPMEILQYRAGSV